MHEKAQTKLNQLPPSPGVYFFKDASRKIIYVGKAAVLKNRVRSYFQKRDRLDFKTQVMVGEIADLEWQVTQSEIDALFLESELIKRYKPKYNIELRDDKHYLYVKITTRDKYPVVSFVRQPLDDGAAYFGPFLQGFALRKALRYLRKTFPYNTHAVLPKRVCLEYHLGLCPGLEEGKTSPAEYRRNLSKLIMFLRGKRSLLIKQLSREMKLAAKRQQFEEAAKLRNQVMNLRALGQQIVFGDQERFDISRDRALNSLAQLARVRGSLRRIEAYDISHSSGTHNAASMIVFSEGVAAKSEYRKFQMRAAGNDDFAHMGEVISRRFSGSNVAKWPPPDLIIIDGGKGQVNAALAALDGLGIAIPTIGLAKRLEQVIIPLSAISNRQKAEGDFEVIQLDKDSEVLKLLQRIRDEAHRFGHAYHSLLRVRSQTKSALEDVPGIGPVRRKLLIKHFGSLKGVKTASGTELAKVVGTKQAATLKQHL